MSKRGHLPKAVAVKKAATLRSVRAILRSLNQVELLRGARVTGADGESTVPIDWMGATIVEDVDGHRSPRSTYAAGIQVPYQQALKDLTDLGLSREDILHCKSCGLWFLTSSRKAEVCPECRPRRWQTKYRRLHRAKLNQLSGVKRGKTKTQRQAK